MCLIRGAKFSQSRRPRFQVKASDPLAAPTCFTQHAYERAAAAHGLCFVLLPGLRVSWLVCGGRDCEFRLPARARRSLRSGARCCDAVRLPMLVQQLWESQVHWGLRNGETALGALGVRAHTSLKRLRRFSPAVCLGLAHTFFRALIFLRCFALPACASASLLALARLRNDCFVLREVYQR